MKATISFSVTIDQECGAALGKAHPLYDQGLNVQRAFTLEGTSLREHMHLLLPLAERVAMQMTGEPGEPELPLPDKARLVGFLLGNTQLSSSFNFADWSESVEAPLGEALTGAPYAVRQ